VPYDLLKLQTLAVRYTDVVFTGRTAAFLLWGRTLDWPATGDLPRNRSAHGGTLLTVRRRDVERTHPVHGVLTTTPVQTAVDVDARWLLERHYRGLTGTERLDADLDALSPRDRKAAEPLIADAVIGTASGPENIALWHIRTALKAEIDAGDITVTTNVPVRGYRFDVVIEEARGLIEIDSYTYHGEGQAQGSSFERDRRQGNQATRWGYLLLRYTDVMVTHEHEYMEDEVADTVRFALKRLRRLRRDEEANSWDTPPWERT
jgi:very-short-patch-repair endonuclease